MYDREAIESVLALRDAGLGARRISRRTGVSVRTVTGWLAGKLPRSASGDRCPVCGGLHPLEMVEPRTYSYLLGLYLGDGYIAAHARGVFRLRISLDTRYPDIIEECEAAMRAIVPESRVCRVACASGCVEVTSYSKSWPCIFPQHGPGKKHERAIELADFQRIALAKAPAFLLRGLIHSDGCRFQNTGTNWSNPRYSFSNRSPDIRRIFCDACDRLGLRWTTAPHTVYVSRKADVARMDQFIGPKS